MVMLPPAMQAPTLPLPIQRKRGASVSSSESSRAALQHFGPCPVHSISIHADDGSSEELDAPGCLQWLQPGRPVFDSGPSMFAEPLHPSFPNDCWYLPGMLRHWSNDLDNFATISFSGGPTRVYVLLPSFINDPR